MFSIKVDNETTLCLREKKDAQAFFDLVDKNRSYLRQWLPWVDDTKSPADSAKYIDECRDHYKKGTSLELGIQYKSEWVGMIGFNKIDHNNRKAEIGYWLDESMQGKGIMTSSAKALIDYGFSTLDLNRIWICCASNNKKSAAIPMRLGFVQEGVRRENMWRYDHFEDTMVFSLLRHEWQDRQ